MSSTSRSDFDCQALKSFRDQLAGCEATPSAVRTCEPLPPRLGFRLELRAAFMRTYIFCKVCVYIGRPAFEFLSVTYSRLVDWPLK